MVEIRLHNPKLRLAVNIILILLFAAFFIYSAVLVGVESSTINQLRERVSILREDVLKKQEALFAAQRKFEQSKHQLNTRQMVDASLALQKQRDTLGGSQSQLADLESQVNDTQKKRLLHIYWIIFALVAFPLIFWLNYILNY